MATARRSRRSRRPLGRNLAAVVEAHQWKLSLLRAFIAKHGWAELGRNTVVPPGVHLFRWVATRRVDYRNDRIADWLVAECEAVPGWSWSPYVDAYKRTIDLLRRYVKKNGWAAVKGKTIVDGVRLHRWLGHRRSEHKRGKLDRWVVTALEAIPGWTWDPRTAGHAHHLKQLRGHVARHGWDSIDAGTRSADGTRIGQWLPNIRAVYRKGGVPAWLAAGLERIPGWIADPRRSSQRVRVARLATFVAKHGWDSMRESLVVRGEPLGVWVSYCRARYREGILPRETITGLEAISGWSWVSPRQRRPPARSVSRRRSGRTREKRSGSA